MSEQPSFWRRFFGRRGSSSLTQRQEKVLQYILQRMGQNVPLQEVLQEEYVRRNTSQAEVERIVASPEFIEAARLQMGESFRSDELKP
jgi:carbamoylphosphate synthase large subunit